MGGLSDQLTDMCNISRAKDATTSLALADLNRAANIARARELLAVPARSEQPDTTDATAVEEPRVLPRPCPCCGGRMIIIETFARGCQPKHRPTPNPAAIRIDTS